ncbi:CAF17-like 4Fe-4S cluster assembly/insertion protein YgfZ [Taklimakanibacter lacteus]|uniref:CAF17-like 4Fe-4S cluster assembly/insertion protein YgfZ n=1 Tax=Taklimakanibacter lacteus TaxID=2268456 RepID=UPI000E664E9C
MQRLPFATHKLAGRAVLTIAGEDARHFLQNLITADIDGLKPGQAAYSALLAPQGKILFDFFVLAENGHYLIDCSAAQKAELLKRLTFYKLRARVTLADNGEEVGVTPVKPESGLAYTDPRAAQLGVRLIAAKGSLPHTDDAAYEGGRIRLGLADSDKDIGSGELFPHEANLDQLGAVSFDKGCFIGQEVVSRMEHRGTARNRIVPVHAPKGAAAKGSEIKAGGKPIGTMLSSAGSDGLALIRLDRLKDAVEAGTALLTEAGPIHVRKPGWARFDVALPRDDDDENE